MSRACLLKSAAEHETLALELRSCGYPNHDASVLKLRVLRLPKITRPKTSGIIPTRRVSEGFTETLVKQEIAIPRSRSGLGWRQTRNFKTRQRGIGALQRNPSLTFRVVISHCIRNRMLFRHCSLGNCQRKQCGSETDPPTGSS